MSETLDTMIQTAKDVHRLNKEIAKEAHAFNKAAAKEAHAFNRELVKAGIEDTDALIQELSDDHQSAE